MKRCKYCKTTKDLTVDHKVPVSLGGTNEDSNLQCLCSRCNSKKSDMTHKQVMGLFKWFNEIQQSRVKHGKKSYWLK